MKKPRKVTPVDRNKHPKSFKEAVLDHLEDTQKRVISIKKDMRKLIVEEVRKEIGDKIDMINGALNEVIIQKKILQEKGLITREEINKKYEELKKK